MASEHMARCKVRIRPMEAKDFDVIFEIDRSLTGADRAVSRTELITEDLGGATDLSLVAETGDKVVGFVLARHAFVGEPVVEACLIQGLGVHPLYQRQGIATSLAKALTEKARLRCISIVRVMLSERDSQMEGFFTRMDFRRARLIVCDRSL